MVGFVKPFSEADDYEWQWALTSFEGRVVMDIGADYGSTAWFFLCKGARKVIAVEGLPVFYRQLVENFKNEDRVAKVLLWIAKPSDFETLFKTWEPEVVKIDIEGAESHLLELPSEVFRIPAEYLVEAHGIPLLEMLKEKFRKERFKIKTVRQQTSTVYILHATRVD